MNPKIQGDSLTRQDVLALLREGMFVQLGPERVAVGWGALERHAAPPPGRDAFYLPDFYLDDPRPWWTAEHTREMLRAELSLSLREQLGPAPTEPPRSLPWSPTDPEAFRAATRSILRHIEAAKIDKAVPVGAEVAPNRILEPGQPTPHLAGRLPVALTRALEAAAPLNAYGAWTHDTAGPSGILGATPELLFALDREGNVDTIALAGTRALRPEHTAEDIAALGRSLLDDPKERREHRFVVVDLQDVLGRLAGGAHRVQVSDTQVMRLPNLLHLRTELSVRPRQPAGFELLAWNLHPTPALGVAPRERGLAWLREHDGIEHRGRFGAPFGYRRKDGSGVCLVAIRNAQWSPEEVRVLAGCGIVAGSDPEREWQELCAKRRSLKLLLGL